MTDTEAQALGRRWLAVAPWVDGMGMTPRPEDAVLNHVTAEPYPYYCYEREEYQDGPLVFGSGKLPECVVPDFRDWATIGAAIGWLVSQDVWFSLGAADIVAIAERLKP